MPGNSDDSVGEFRGVIGILGADSAGGCCRAVGLGEAAGQ